jgi:hypothetical protein
MTPDQIKTFIEAHYPDILCKRLKHGWSFWYREIISRPYYSTRIARARQNPDSSVAELKLAVTARRRGEKGEHDVITKEQLQYLFDRELKRWHEDVKI